MLQRLGWSAETIRNHVMESDEVEVQSKHFHANQVNWLLFILCYVN
jgi:hypothetical protein